MSRTIHILAAAALAAACMASFATLSRSSVAAEVSNVEAACGDIQCGIVFF